jgi:hypothetical protein
LEPHSGRIRGRRKIRFRLEAEHGVKAATNNASNAELYTGSIILVPTQGEQCLERALDNRTGQMWDKGYVNCYDVVRNTAKNSGLSSSRMRLIGNAFLHKTAD